MNMHSGGNTYETDSVVPFAPRAAAPSDEADQLDKAGQIILRLLHKAAGVAEENSRHALERHRSFRISFARPRIGSLS